MPNLFSGYSLIANRLTAAQALSDIAIQVVLCIDNKQPNDNLTDLLESRADLRILPVTHLNHSCWQNEAEADAMVFYCPEGGYSQATIRLIKQYLETEVVAPALAIFYESVEDAQHLRNSISQYSGSTIPLLPGHSSDHALEYAAMANIDAWFQDIRFQATNIRRDRIRWLKHETRILADNTGLEANVKKYITEPVYQVGKDAGNLIQNLYKKGKQWW
uniref:hypothetical protein n=1 Tax=Roseivirga sp. TaxID=1964215 RepID=UPI00404825D7